jgi:hypothetical protein
MNFLPVKGYEGNYEVSDTGEVRSIDRTIQCHNGVTLTRKGLVLKQNPHKDTSYFLVSLWKGNVGSSFYVHRLVAETFLPNKDFLPEVNPKDGNRQNNSVSNLEWVTSLENKLHAIQTGLRVYSNRLTRDEFIECLQCVISGESYKSLSKRVPYNVPFLSTKLRKLAKELKVEHELDQSLYIQRVERARVNGNPHYRTNTDN